MSWRHCCCNCLIHEDHFEREYGTPLRGRWCDKPGDYFIENFDGSNEVVCYTPEQIAILNVRHPDSVGSMSVSFTTKAEEPRLGSYGPGQKYRIILNAVRVLDQDGEVCTTSTYYFAEYERLGAANNPSDLSWLRLGIAAAGSESILKAQQLIAPETGLSRTFTATIDENAFCATLTGTILGQATVATQDIHNGGFYCGFELSEENMRIDDFVFYKHYNSNPPLTREQQCPSCGLCKCEVDGVALNFELPPKLNVCVHTEPSNCERLAGLDNCCFEIDYDDLQGGWVHPDFECCAGFNFIFSCDEDSGINRYSLGNQGGCRQSGGDSPSRSPIEYGCDEERGTGTFLFGPYCIAGTDLACACRDIVDLTDPVCCYYVTVSTEACCES